MTGPMQINGRGDLSFEVRLALELAYIEHYWVRHDLAILLRTLPAVVRGQGRARIRTAKSALRKLLWIPSSLPKPWSSSCC